MEVIPHHPLRPQVLARLGPSPPWRGPEGQFTLAASTPSLTMPRGWKLTYEGGKRQAINPAGERVAYNQLLNAQAQRSGFRNHYDYLKYAGRLKAYRKHEVARPKLMLGTTTLKEF